MGRPRRGGRARSRGSQRDVAKPLSSVWVALSSVACSAVRLSVAMHTHGWRQAQILLNFTGFDFEDDVHRILGVAGRPGFDGGLVSRCFLFFEAGISSASVFSSQFTGSLRSPRRRAQPISSGATRPAQRTGDRRGASTGVRQRLWISHLGLHLRILTQQQAQCAQRPSLTTIHHIHLQVKRLKKPPTFRPTTPPSVSARPLIRGICLP